MDDLPIQPGDVVAGLEPGELVEVQRVAPFGSKVLVAATIEDDGEPAALLDMAQRGVTQPELPTDVDYVRVMSLHKSGQTDKEPETRQVLDDRSLAKWETGDPENPQGRAGLRIARDEE